MTYASGDRLTEEQATMILEVIKVWLNDAQSTGLPLVAEFSREERELPPDPESNTERWEEGPGRTIIITIAGGAR